VNDTLNETHDKHQPLTILSSADPDALKALAEDLIPHLEPITVRYNRTGLVMLPYTDSANGTPFYIGEVLIAEARAAIHSDAAAPIEGYGACLGYDLEQALAIALIDAALRAGVETEAIQRFLTTAAAQQAAADAELLKAVESTRAQMETF
jgi:alpha-D-ribose 1-methylphosphonate 5-triphosphate synthase subunit PhnG